MWVALEGSRFRDSPFYCQIGTERDTPQSRSNPFFLLFVKECCNFALRELGDGEQIRKWTAIRDSPHIPPKLHTCELQLTWKAVTAFLNKDVRTRVVLRKFSEGKLVFLQRFGCKKGMQDRTINVLEWNSGVEPRFDLLQRQEIRLD